MTKEPQQPDYARELFSRIFEECSHVIVGKRDVIELLVTAVFADGHVLLEGVPGVAKTHVAKTFAKTLGCAFRRIQFTPDLLPADITGSYIFDQKIGDFRLHQGPIFSNIVLIDEINRGMPKTQSATLEIMQERQVTIEGNTLPVDEPFVVLGTMNPIELQGVYPLSEAQIDRFMFKVELGYPTVDEEHELLERINDIQNRRVEPIALKEEICKAKSLVDPIHVAQPVRRYMVDLIEATRKHPKLRLGGSPRALIHLFKSCKAFALAKGRGYVIPDDVKQLIVPVLRHRLLLTGEAMAEDTKTDEVIAEILKETPIPQSDTS